MATKTQNEGPEGRKNRHSGPDRPLTSAAGLLAPLADTDTPADEQAWKLTEQVRTGGCGLGMSAVRDTGLCSENIQEANEPGCGHRLSDGPAPGNLSPLPP